MLVTRVVGVEYLQVVSELDSGVRWSSRIDREGFYLGVRIHGRQGAAVVRSTLKGLLVFDRQIYCWFFLICLLV